MGTAAAMPATSAKPVATRPRFVPAAVAKAVQYAQVEALLVERNSQRSIARVTGVARMTIAKWVKKSGGGLAAPAPAAAEKSAAQGMGNLGIG